MSKIHVLDNNTINKIAAGEVVERPASAIKELIENAMDAGASRIEIEIMAGGTSFMRVTDNGKGMSAEDAQLAILRHATSKIRDAHDLSMIGTLGFRGEALPTIASVSRFSLLTREPKADLGTRIDIRGGNKPEITEAGCALGTTITVEDLFFNTPARKKFLKTTHTEGSKINDFIVKLALARPNIEFRFINNNKTAIVTPGNGSLLDTILAIYGKQTAESVLPLYLEGESISISGFITKPSMLKSSRAWQTLIVNGRIIQNRAISKAIDNAYRSLIPKSGFPLAVLLVKVPQHTIDVNVHPQKNELKFEDESRIFKAVYKAVLDAIRSIRPDLHAIASAVEKPMSHVTTEPMRFMPASSPNNDQGVAHRESLYHARPPQTIYEAVHANAVPAMHFMETQEEIRHGQTIRESNPPIYSVATGPMEESCESTILLASEGNIVPIGQVDLTYIIAQDAKGLYIIDQHAAHERILFDKLSAMADRIPSQQLLIHLVLHFDSRDAQLIAANKDIFERLGFQMEASGNEEYRLMEVPADIPSDEAEDIIREILASLHDMHETSAKEIRQACLATTACRAAIKAGEELSMRQMQIILEELSHTTFPYTCPHGRPTILKFSTDELAKMFKRTGF